MDVAAIDWEWWAFREGMEAESEPQQKRAHDGGFQAITSLTCPQCEKARYGIWIFTGTGHGAPTQGERMLAAEKELRKLLLKQCPEHPAFIKKN
jgi:hypothetical protein